MSVWINTTEKDSKIYSDMFITDSRGKYEFVEIYKGEIANRKEITFSEKQKIIKEHDLIKRGEIFKNCFTHRNKQSWVVIDDLMSKIRTTEIN